MRYNHVMVYQSCPGEVGLQSLKRACEARQSTLALFNPGATDAEVKEFIERLGVEPPPALIDLLRWKNGTYSPSWEDGGGDEMEATLDDMRLLSTGGIIGSLEIWNELALEAEKLTSAQATAADYHQGLRWSSSWIPVMENDYTWLALATQPCFGGPAGQLISMDFKEWGSWRVLHLSIGDWLATLAALAETDAFDLSDPSSPAWERKDKLLDQINPLSYSVDMKTLPQEVIEQRTPCEPSSGAHVGRRVRIVTGQAQNFLGELVELPGCEGVIRYSPGLLASTVDSYWAWVDSAYLGNSPFLQAAGRNFATCTGGELSTTEYRVYQPVMVKFADIELLDSFEP